MPVFAPKIDTQEKRQRASIQLKTQDSILLQEKKPSLGMQQERFRTQTVEVADGEISQSIGQSKVLNLQLKQILDNSTKVKQIVEYILDKD